MFQQFPTYVGFRLASRPKPNRDKLGQARPSCSNSLKRSMAEAKSFLESTVPNFLWSRWRIRLAIKEHSETRQKKASAQYCSTLLNAHATSMPPLQIECMEPWNVCHKTQMNSAHLRLISQRLLPWPLVPETPEYTVIKIALRFHPRSNLVTAHLRHCQSSHSSLSATWEHVGYSTI